MFSRLFSVLEHMKTVVPPIPNSKFPADAQFSLRNILPELNGKTSQSFFVISVGEFHPKVVIAHLLYRDFHKPALVKKEDFNTFLINASHVSLSVYLYP